MGKVVICNFCTHRKLLRSAERTHASVILEPAPDPKLKGGADAVNCYVVPFGQELDRKKHFRVWFMRRPEGCRC